MSVKSLFDIADKVALITGASRGLGLQVAFALGEAGAKVAICSGKSEELKKAAYGILQNKYLLRRADTPAHPGRRLAHATAIGI